MCDELKEIVDARIRKDPTNPLIYVQAAAAFAILGDFREARGYARQALDLEPNYQVVLRSKVPLLFERGRDLLDTPKR